MKKATFVALLVPVLFFGTSILPEFEQTASADRGRGGRSVGREGSVSRGSSSVRSSDSFRYGGRGGFSGSRGYAGHRGYYGYRGGYGGHSHSYYSTSLWIGPGWGWSVWDPYYYPYYSYPFYPYPYYSAPTVVVPREPEEYIYQAPRQEEARPEPRQEEPPGYWYYCKEKNGYYPYVERCPSGWMRVVPYTPPQNQDEEN